MSVRQESPEREKKVFHYEVVEGLDDETRMRIKAFTKRAKENFFKKKDEFVQSGGKMSSEVMTSDEMYGHGFSLSANGSLVVSGIFGQGDLQKSFVVFSTHNHETVGLRIIGIAGNGEVISSFMGVEYPFLRKGVATELVRKTHEVLKKRGYTQYEVQVWEASKKVIEKVTGKELIKLDSLDGKRYLVEL